MFKGTLICFFQQRRFAQLLSILTIVSLLAVSVPAAPGTITDGAAAVWQEARFAFLSSDITHRLPGLVAAFFAPRRRPGDRESTIVEIRIFPGPLNLRQGQEVDLSAIAFDDQGQSLHGVAFQWTVTDTGRERPARPLLNSTFRAVLPGSLVITARAGGREAAIPVTVERFRNEIPADAEVHRVVSRTGQRVRVRTSQTEQPNDSKVAKGEDEVSLVQLLPGDGWNDGNWQSSGSPGNQTGNPPGSPEDGGAGSGNFQLSAPVLSLCPDAGSTWTSSCITTRASGISPVRN